MDKDEDYFNPAIINSNALSSTPRLKCLYHEELQTLGIVFMPVV
jgi:hypothetical protein